MRSLCYTVPTAWRGARVSAYLRLGLGLSARALAGIKYGGGMTLNGAPCRAGALLQEGDRLELFLPDERTDYPAAPAGAPLTMAVYEDQDFLVVNKPADMPVHPSPGHDLDSLVSAVAGHCLRTGQAYRIRPLYRLDKDTSGLLPIAKHKIAAGAKLSKLYLAVCQGILDGSGVINAPIGLKDGSKIQRQVRPQGQPSVTRWRALARSDGHTLIALRLDTGRTHQIRVHMAHIGRPLAGDDLYGGALSPMGRQALHMHRLHISCPALLTDLSLCQAPPKDMLEAFPWVEKYVFSQDTLF